MAVTVPYVAEPQGSTFSFCDEAGRSIDIGDSPVDVDARFAPYLDGSKFVKRVGGETVTPDPAPEVEDADETPDPDGGEEG